MPIYTSIGGHCTVCARLEYFIAVTSWSLVNPKRQQVEDKIPTDIILVIYSKCRLQNQTNAENCSC